MRHSLRSVLSVAASVLVTGSCILGATVPASAAASAARGGFFVTASKGTGNVAPQASPNCGNGVGPRKVVATYKAKSIGSSGYRTDTLYCGNNSYGYRHLLPHVGQYFGGWGNFSFSIGQTLKAPVQVIKQANGNYRESAPIYQCFYAGYYYIWTFYVVPVIKSGQIVTAYGSRGKRVNTSCP